MARSCVEAPVLVVASVEHAASARVVAAATSAAERRIRRRGEMWDMEAPLKEHRAFWQSVDFGDPPAGADVPRMSPVLPASSTRGRLLVN
jgi:hypothetical protein